MILWSFSVSDHLAALHEELIAFRRAINSDVLQGYREYRDIILDSSNLGLHSSSNIVRFADVILEHANGISHDISEIRRALLSIAQLYDMLHFISSVIETLILNERDDSVRAEAIKLMGSMHSKNGLSMSLTTLKIIKDDRASSDRLKSLAQAMIYYINGDLERYHESLPASGY